MHKAASSGQNERVKTLLESGEDVDQRDQVLVFSSSLNSSVKLIFFSHMVCVSSIAYEQAIASVFAVGSRVSSQRENRPFAGGHSRVKKAVLRCQRHIGACEAKNACHHWVKLDRPGEVVHCAVKNSDDDFRIG